MDFYNGEHAWYYKNDAKEAQKVDQLFALFNAAAHATRVSQLAEQEVVDAERAF